MIQLDLFNDDTWEQFCASEINSVLEQVEYIVITADPPRNLLEFALTKLSQIIKFSTHLRSIYLYGEHVNHRLLSTVCEALQDSTVHQKIEFEYVSGETTTSDNFLPVANLMKKCKREIGLWIECCDDEIQGETLDLLADALRNLSGAATKLFVSAGIGDNEACAIAENLQVNTQLTNLTLANNSIGNIGAEALAGALKENGALIKLDLSCNSIGGDGAKALAGALKQNASLTTLKLSDNSIGDDGAVALGEAIACNVTLDSLWLYSNYDITVKVGMEALANGLNRNSTLMQSDLSYYHGGIAFALRRNKALLKEAAWMEYFSDQDIVLKSKMLSNAMERYSMSNFRELTFLFLQRERATLLTQAESVVESGGPAPKKRRV